MNEKYRASLHTALYKYYDVFLGTFPTRELPNQKLEEIDKIPLLEGAVPIKKPMYRHSPWNYYELKKNLEELLEAGTIQPSLSP